jgi:thioredoxin reductase (NADPH)
MSFLVATKDAFCQGKAASSLPAAGRPPRSPKGASPWRAWRIKSQLNSHYRPSHTSSVNTLTPFDVICIGAGPTGLACAIEAKRAGLRPLVIDKGCLCNSLYHYPTNMVFFTTPERMEIGDLPMTTVGGKPTRAEALKYYRRAAEHYQIDVAQYQRVERVSGHDGAFIVSTRESNGAHNQSAASHEYRARKLILATGYYDLPNFLSVPGEDLPHVSHYFTDAHPYWNEDVVVIGAKNSAAEAALDLFRGGARVTLIHRGAELGRSLKYWVRPDIENRIKAGEIQARFNTKVVRFEPGKVVIHNGAGAEELPAFHAFAMTGYHPDFSFLESVGIRLDPKSRKPQVNLETLETNVPGIYVAGVLVGGIHTGEIFIENGRFHGRQIVAAIAGREGPREPAPVSPPGE